MRHHSMFKKNIYFQNLPAESEMNNLNTHKKVILQGVHRGRSDAAEIEINVMDIECTDWRIGDMERLVYEVEACTQRRNDNAKKIDWGFTNKKADEKLSNHYAP